MRTTFKALNLAQIIGAVCTVPLLLLCTTTAADTLNVTDDAYVAENKADNNFGHNNQVWVKDAAGDSVGYVRFDLTPLPAGIGGADIEEATLRMYVDNVSQEGSVDVYTVDDDWDEHTITWNNAPTASVAGGSVAIVDADEQHWVTVDVTAEVAAWVDGDPNYGLQLRPNSVKVNLGSKETRDTHEMQIEVALVSVGPQGEQGKLGDTGPQGDQGKLGPQGDQGKLGPQGEQGKLGNTGPQGDQGPQGKIGPQGEPGPPGPPDPNVAVAVCELYTHLGLPEPEFCGCHTVDGLLWCEDVTLADQSCNSICGSKGLAPIASNAVWFAAQDTAAECAAIAGAFGYTTPPALNSWTFGCAEKRGANNEPICSTFSGCPQNHRTGSDGGSHTGMCPCE